MNILDFYKSVLSCAGVTVDPKTSLLSLQPDEDSVPIVITIDKKVVALPTKERLAEASDDVILFHPVAESLVRKESPVARQLRKLLMVNLNAKTQTLFEYLVNYAADDSKHADATPDQRDYLSKVANITKKLVPTINKVLANIDGKAGNRMVSQTIREGSTLNGEEYKRVSLISFPFLNKLNLSEKTWCGVKLSAKDLATVTELLAYMFPKWDVKDRYSTGSHELAAPNFHAMLKGLLPLYTQINMLVDTFNLEDEYGFDTAYAEGLDLLAKYRARIPVQPGNVGDPIEGNDHEAKEEMPGHERSKVSKEVADTPSVHEAPKPQESNVPRWKQAIKERTYGGAPDISGLPPIEGELPPEERDKLNWTDRRKYDAYIREEVAAREEAMLQQVHRSQTWRNGGGQSWQQPQQQHRYAGASQPIMGRSQYEQNRQYLNNEPAPLRQQMQGSSSPYGNVSRNYRSY